MYKTRYLVPSPSSYDSISCTMEYKILSSATTVQHLTVPNSEIAILWEFKLEKSLWSQLYLQRNEKVENAIKTTNQLIWNARVGQKDPYLVILYFENSPTLNLQTGASQRVMKSRTKHVATYKTKFMTTKGVLQNYVCKEIQ